MGVDVWPRRRKHLTDRPEVEGESRHPVRRAARRPPAGRGLLLHRRELALGGRGAPVAGDHPRDHARRRAHDRVPRGRRGLLLGGDRRRSRRSGSHEGDVILFPQGDRARHVERARDARARRRQELLLLAAPAAAALRAQPARQPRSRRPASTAAGGTAPRSSAASWASTRGRSTPCWPRCRGCCTCPGATARRRFVGDDVPARGRRRVEPAASRRRGGARADERDALRRGAAPPRRLAARRSRPGGWRGCATRPSAARSALLHEKPAEPWTLETLARGGGDCRGRRSTSASSTSSASRPCST